MRDGWTETALGGLSNISYGYTESATVEIVGPKFLRITDIQDSSVDWDLVPYCRIDTKQLEKQRLANGDIVFARTGATTGKSFLLQNPPEAVCASYLIRLRPKVAMVIPYFLNLNFQTAWYWSQVRSGTTGSAQGGFNASKLAAVTMNLPPLAEQKRIVDVVSSVDTYIESLQAQVDAARTARNAVLHELLSAGGDDWTETMLGSIAVFHNGRAYKQSELLLRGKYRVLRVGNFFSNGNWYWSDLELNPNKYCDYGDLLYAWSASFGPHIWRDEKVIYHYHIWKVEEDPLHVDKKFLFYWLEDDVQRMKRDAGTGSIMMHITKGEIEARSLALPPLVEQRRIVDVVSSMDEVIQTSESTLSEAKRLRSGLLSDLLSGEHEIPESYDRFLKAA